MLLNYLYNVLPSCKARNPFIRAIKIAINISLSESAICFYLVSIEFYRFPFRLANSTITIGPDATTKSNDNN